MSLVQAVVCDQFVFVAGEQQLNLSSGGVLHNFRKIFKLNDNVIIGLSGSMDDNYYLFQDYLTMDFELRDEFADSLEEVFDRVSARYQEMTEQGQCDVFSLVCGWNGRGFEAKTFFIDGVYKYGCEIYGLQRAFRDVLAKGVMFDDFIDKNAQFEVIQRPE